MVGHGLVQSDRAAQSVGHSILRGQDKGKRMLQGTRMRVLGSMSGTSLDGVDAAVIETDGEAVFDFGPAAYRPYSVRMASGLAACTSPFRLCLGRRDTKTSSSLWET